MTGVSCWWFTCATRYRDVSRPSPLATENQPIRELQLSNKTCFVLMLIDQLLATCQNTNRPGTGQLR